MFKVNDFWNIFLSDLLELYPGNFQHSQIETAAIYIDYWYALQDSQAHRLYPDKLFVAVSQEGESCDYAPFDNVIHIIGCHGEFEKHKHRSDFVNVPTWFLTTYRANRADLRKTSSTTLTEYHCDFLLGGQTRHRISILDLLKTHDLLDVCLVNLRARQHPWGTDGLVGDPNTYTSKILSSLDPLGFESCYDSDGKIFTMRKMDAFEGLIFFSQLIPWRIYDKTMISFVAETESPEQDIVFFTEKTAKPLLAGRPFILLGAQGCLESLRSYGFRTFHPWIDETYDSASDHQQRLNLAFDSFLQFTSKTVDEKSQMLSALQPILEHNRNLIVNREKWLQPLMQKIYQWGKQAAQ